MGCHGFQQAQGTGADGVDSSCPSQDYGGVGGAATRWWALGSSGTSTVVCGEKQKRNSTVVCGEKQKKKQWMTHRPHDPEDPMTQDPEARLRRSLRLNRSIFYKFIIIAIFTPSLINCELNWLHTTETKCNHN
jgi:hypothetical protein